ncbi:MAG: sodium:proton antiporter [Acidobacteria bacterium]|nr:sodium:proton antiporter [Acidobacteriota bacterium]
MTPFELISMLITIAALLSFFNYRWLRVTPTIGVTMLALSLSLVVVAVGRLSGVHHWTMSAVSQIDFPQIVLHGMLAFLLFAGSLHLDSVRLRRHKLPVLLLAVAGTMVSTILVALLMWGVFHLIRLEVSMTACLLFGALISPTDPIAVLAILRSVNGPKRLETLLAGESLFNDGVGAVLFVTLLEASSSGHLPGFLGVARLLAVEAGGGIAIGLAAGFLTSALLVRVNDYQTEILLTLALAMGGYALADALHVSAPLEAVVAGLVLSARREQSSVVSAAANDYLDKFWELVDGILNAVLFMLLGLEMLIMSFPFKFLLAGALAIPVVLLARGVTVAGVMTPLHWGRHGLRSEIALLTWGGLRGGLSLALALSLPMNGTKDLLLAVTYIVVVFAIVVQGLSMPALARRDARRTMAAAATQAAEG